MANKDLPSSTPLGVHQGVTDATTSPIRCPALRWGILGTCNISSQ